jgi:hypothetical protein
MLSAKPAAALALAALLPAATPAHAAGARRVVLVRDGAPAATIVVSAHPTCAAQFAACELQWHVEQMTGAILPIVRDEAGAPEGPLMLCVGDTARARQGGLTQRSFEPQEHAIRFVPRAILLVGRDADNRAEVKYDLSDLAACENWPGFWEERGTLDAVYDFLEKLCGVRWLNPTESGTVLPKTRTLAVSARDLRRKPAFEFRDAIGATGDDPLRYDAYTALWPESTDGYKTYEAAAYPKLHAQYDGTGRYLQAKRMSSRLFLLRMRNGGQPVRCNHSLYGYYQRFWEQSPDPNAAKLFVERRPEMFAKGYEGQPPQMCYTSRELIDQLVQDARDYYDGVKTGADLGIFWRPTLPNPFPVEPMDNSSFCQCDECRKWLAADRRPGANVFSTGLYSDYFFHFVNEVQKGLARTHPDKSIVTLAYASHAMRPEKVKLDPRVIVEFCFATNRSPASREGYESELRTLKSWGTEGVGRRLYLWLYYTFPVETANNGKYHCFPGFFAHTIGEQFRLFHKYGYRGMFHCGYGQDVEAYVTFKLMDDPDAKVETLLADYFTGLYGPAAKPMRQLYEEIERTYCDPANYPKEGVSGAELSWGYLGTEERMARLASLLQEAKSLAQTDEQKHRVELFDLSVWSYMVAGREQYVARQAAPIPSVRAPRVPDAAGEVARVDWSKAAPLPGGWYDRGSAEPSPRKLSGRLAHDGTCLYVELTDDCDTSKLQASAMVFPYDDWELFVAAQRALPYRQFAVGPTGLIAALSHGEVNFRRNVPLEDHGVTAHSDTSAPDRWTVRLALPLSSLAAGGIAPGAKVYLNILRISSPAVNGTGALGLDTWVSHCTVHEVDRLAEITVAP